MKKNKLSTKSLTLIVLFFLLSFFLGSKYENYKIKKDIKNKYLNSFYSELGISLTYLSYLGDKSIANPNLYVEFYEQFLNNFEKLGLINEKTNFYLALKKQEHSYKFNWTVMHLSDYLKGGLNINGILVFNGILEDNIISENEKAFLKEIYNDLEKIRIALYDKKTGQENQNISFEEIAKILEPFSQKYDSNSLKELKFEN